MLSKKVLVNNIPYISSEDQVKDIINYMSKTINSSFRPTIDELLPVGAVLQSTMSEDVFKNEIGKNWKLIGNTVVGARTVNVFEKIN